MGEQNRQKKSGKRGRKPPPFLLGEISKGWSFKKKFEGVKKKKHNEEKGPNRKIILKSKDYPRKSRHMRALWGGSVY